MTMDEFLSSYRKQLNELEYSGRKPHEIFLSIDIWDMLLRQDHSWFLDKGSGYKASAINPNRSLYGLSVHLIYDETNFIKVTD